MYVCCYVFVVYINNKFVFIIFCSSFQSKTLDIQNKKVTSSEIMNMNSLQLVKNVEIKKERDVRDYEEITKQLEEARRQAEMYKEQLMLKEKEAEQYKLQLQSLKNGGNLI